MKLSFEKGFFAPLPVLIIGTYNANGTPNAMNAAWGGQAGMNQISVSLAASHKTTENIRLNKEFTVAYATAEQIAACDYVGIVSGNNDENKLEKCGFTENAEKFCPTLYFVKTSASKYPPETPWPIHLIPSPEPPPEPPAPQPPIDSHGVAGTIGELKPA